MYTVLKIGDIPVVWNKNGSIEIKEVEMAKNLSRADWSRIERLENGEEIGQKEYFIRKHPGIENLRTIQFASANWPCDLKVELQGDYRITKFPSYLGDITVIDSFTPSSSDFDTVFFETVELKYNKKKVYAIIKNDEITKMYGGRGVDRMGLHAFIRENMGISSTLYL